MVVIGLVGLGVLLLLLLVMVGVVSMLMKPSSSMSCSVLGNKLCRLDDDEWSWTGNEPNEDAC